MNTKLFFQIISSCMVVSPKKDVRYYLNGIHIKQDDNGLLIESTDGHRLVRYQYTYKLQGMDEFDVILDINYIKPMLDKMKVMNYHKTVCADVVVTNVDDGFINFNFDTVKIVDGRYPDCDRVIWKHDKYSKPITEYGINLDYLADIAKIQKPFKAGKFNGCKLEFKSEGDSVKFTYPTNEDGLEMLGLIMPCRL